jgi:pimeloyl-ACP methyl ester carboxylesterase
MILTIDRAFTRIEEGQIHYRAAGKAAHGRPPVWMMHPSPTSSLSLMGLMQAVGDGIAMLAPDTPGNGDSVALNLPAPQIADYAEAHIRAIRSLGLEKVDLYGSHTGAHIAIEIAIAAPDLVRRVVLDGIATFAPDEAAEMISTYAPHTVPDRFGAQFNWAWHFVRDQAWFWPWFKQNPENNRGLAPPEPRALHAAVVEVLKSIETYHLAYRAAFAHNPKPRLPLVAHETLVVGDEADPLAVNTEEVTSLLKNGRSRFVRGKDWPTINANKGVAIREFLLG